MQTHLSPAHADSMLTSVRDIKLGQELLKIERLLGLMAAATNVKPLTLLFQFWLKSRGFHHLNRPSRVIRVTHCGIHVLQLWKRPGFLNRGLAQGACCGHKSLTMNASLMGCCAVLDG